MHETPKNTIEFKAYSRDALFTDPVTKTGGEKCSYHIPTYEAIKGICKSIYWKPTFIWIIDEVRVIKKIEMETKGIRPINYNGGNDLSIYTYLKNVEYQVRAHFDWNNTLPELKQDQIDGKHFAIAVRSLEKGGRQDIFLGARECQGYVEPCKFGTGSSFYDNTEELRFGMMFHGFDYPNETGSGSMMVRLWSAEMKKGIIKFPKPSDCKIVKKVKDMKQSSKYLIDINFKSVESEEAVI
jgi:CRISPR-associated protein Cas5d